MLPRLAGFSLLQSVVAILLYLHHGWCSWCAGRVVAVSKAKARSREIPEDDASLAFFLWGFFPLYSVVKISTHDSNAGERGETRARVREREERKGAGTSVRVRE